MFLEVTGDGEANKIFKDEGAATSRPPNSLFRTSKKPFDVADASVSFEKREPQSVKIGKELYRNIWDFVGYCIIGEKKLTYKNNRKTKWIVEPDSVRLEPRGAKSAPLAIFNPAVVGDPRDNILLHVLYVADDLQSVNKAEVLAGFLLMEYVRKRVFVIRTRSMQSMGSNALFCWAQTTYGSGSRTQQKKAPKTTSSTTCSSFQGGKSNFAAGI